MIEFKQSQFVEVAAMEYILRKREEKLHAEILKYKAAKWACFYLAGLLLVTAFLT